MIAHRSIPLHPRFILANALFAFCYYKALETGSMTAARIAAYLLIIVAANVLMYFVARARQPWDKRFKL